MFRIVAWMAVAGGLLAASAPAPGFDAGVSVYNSKCIICHGSGVLGAPKLGDVKAWEPRIAKGEDVLLKNVTKGMKNMPPKGTCTECSASDLADAISFMLSQSE